MNLNDLPKQYDPQAAQQRWYAFWLEHGFFRASDTSDKPPYCVVIPPPNVTGALHLGHALNNTLQDILIRWKRMAGFNTLWMPGTDHAGIATQAVVERRLLEEEKKTRHDLGREALVERIWDWKDQYEQRILAQLRAMGCSCDWDRGRFTLDPICARAVRTTFFRLFQKGLIYRGKRLVNWDTHLGTAVADDEIYYEEIQGQLWTIHYPIVGGDAGEALPVATTRPETMLGDTAVAVHPDDKRYRKYIGRQVELPLTGRKIPIIGDDVLVDPELGTGCVKVTPAHDPNDYQTGLRHDLPMINLLNPDGTYNANAGARYEGLPIKQVRKKVVEDLEAAGLLVKAESYVTRLNFSDRSKTPIEPYLSDQWFVKMDDLAQRAMNAVTDGQVKFHPERYAKSYLDWLGEKRDWCISRQLWWGHRIPIWYARKCDESALKSAFGDQPGIAWTESEAEPGSWLVCAEHDLAANAVPGVTLEQDPDVLDTWFSSALWPHSTLGWPEPTAALATFYPTNALVTSRDIITLWVARMVIFGQFNMKDVPFRDVFIHPVIQDGEGKRMSKSAGNGIDPMDIIDLHGADTLRYTLASLATETQDTRLPVKAAALPDGRGVNVSEKFEQGRTFPNKIWNAARFTLMNLEGFEPSEIDISGLPLEDRWILSRLARGAAEATADLENYQFADLARKLRDLFWSELCDWYLEMVKSRLRDPLHRPLAQNVLATVLDGFCRLLHPIIPFVTEQVWQALGSIAPVRGLPTPTAAAPSVCVAPWPAYPESWIDPHAEEVVAQWREKVQAIRNLRAEKKVPDKAKIRPMIVTDPETRMRLLAGEMFLTSLTDSSSVEIVTGHVSRPTGSAVAVLADAEIVLPMEGLIDHDAEVARLEKNLGDLDKQLAAARAKLGNHQFVSRAPAEVVAQQRDRAEELEAQRQAVLTLISQARQGAV